MFLFTIISPRWEVVAYLVRTANLAAEPGVTRGVIGIHHNPSEQQYGRHGDTNGHSYVDRSHDRKVWNVIRLFRQIDGGNVET